MDAFQEFVNTTMQRYRDSSLKIETFRLHCRSCHLRNNVIIDAMKMGATHLDLLLSYSLALPQEVLASETLLRLSASYCEVDVKNDVPRCPRLRSLTLVDVSIRNDDLFQGLISRSTSMEELSLSRCRGMILRRANLHEFRKLERLHLEFVSVDSLFFANFASRFPCLKDLTVDECDGCTRLHIVSTSLRTVSFVPRSGSDRARFDVPNIRRFTYSARGLPSNLFINGAWREWELDISITCSYFKETSWFINLKKVLSKFRLSRLSLFINLRVAANRITDSDHKVDEIEVVPEPIVVETLMINAPPTFCCALLVRSFMVFRPKFVTDRLWTKYYPCLQRVVKPVRDRLVQLLFLSNRKDMFGEFGLKKVNVEIYDDDYSEWRPLGSKKLPKADSEAKVRLQLKWES